MSRCRSTTAPTGWFPRSRACRVARTGEPQILSVDDVPGGAQVTFLTTIEREGSDKPCCVVESIIRYLALPAED